MVLEKHKARLQERQEALSILPDTWPDFARICDIRSGDSVIKFDPYDFQTAIIDAIETAKYTCIGKVRQIGETEAISNYFLWKACRKTGYLAVIFSQGQTDTSNIARRIRRMVESLQPYGVVAVTDSLTDQQLSVNGVVMGRILFRNSSPNGARGLESVSDILYDEAGFVDGIDSIYASSHPTTSMLGDRARIIILSTPNGQGGWYFDRLNSDNGAIDVLQLCEDMRARKTSPVQIWKDQKGWNKVLVHWRAHPIYGVKDNYIEKIIEETGLPETQVRQEYDLSFVDSEESVFPPLLIRSAAILEDLERCYDKSFSYFMGVDSATTGSDYTVGVVIKWDRVKQEYSIADIYRKRKQSTDYDVHQLASLAEKYKPLAIGVESNAIGAIYLQQLQTKLPSANWQGLNTTQDSKLVGAGRINLLLEKNKLLIPTASYFVEQFFSFKRYGKRLEAVSGKHDDVIMALIVGLQVSPFLFKT